MKLIIGIVIGAYISYRFYQLEIKRVVNAANRNTKQNIAVSLQGEGWQAERINKILANA